MDLVMGCTLMVTTAWKVKVITSPTTWKKAVNTPGTDLRCGPYLQELLKAMYVYNAKFGHIWYIITQLTKNTTNSQFNGKNTNIILTICK